MLSGCSDALQELKILSAPIEIKQPPKIPRLPLPEPIVVKEVRWHVITPERFPAGDRWALVCVDAVGYEHLSLIQSDTLRFIKEAMWRLEFYDNLLSSQEVINGEESTN